MIEFQKINEVKKENVSKFNKDDLYQSFSSCSRKILFFF